MINDKKWGNSNDCMYCALYPTGYSREKVFLGILLETCFEIQYTACPALSVCNCTKQRGQNHDWKDGGRIIGRDIRPSIFCIANYDIV